MRRSCWPNQWTALLDNTGGIAVQKSIFFLIAGVMLAMTMPTSAERPTIKEQIVGTWRVINLTATSNGVVRKPLGDRPAGYVSITATRIWLLFVDSTRKPPAAATLTDAEAVAAMKSHVAWTGRYVTSDTTPDGVKLTAHVDTASSEALNGNDSVYSLRVEGSKLLMKSPGVIVPMTGALSVVDIELERAE